MDKANRLSNSKSDSILNFAYFGGEPLFNKPKSTSNLTKPSFKTFLSYSKLFFEKKQYSNNGILVNLLETRLAKFHNVRYCITFCNGFWALVLTIKSLALEGKTEIIMPSLTYRRLADIAAWLKLSPKFCEVEINSLAIDPSSIESCINKNTAAILAVHPIINCCDVKKITNIANKYSLPLIFDSVESPYESIDIGKVGEFGNAECFSMHASKLINGFEGGYVTTNCSKLAEKLKAIRAFGFAGEDNCIFPNGMNAKLNELHAALSLSNLDELSAQIQKNKLCYYQYKRELKSFKGIKLLEFNESFPTSYKNIVVEILESWPLNRDETVQILNAENILARAYYSPPLHRKKMTYNYIPTYLRLTDCLAKKYLLLPCGYQVSVNDITLIIEILRNIQTHGQKIKQELQKKAHNESIKISIF